MLQNNFLLIPGKRCQTHKHNADNPLSKNAVYLKAAVIHHFLEVFYILPSAKQTPLPAFFQGALTERAIISKCSMLPRIPFPEPRKAQLDKAPGQEIDITGFKDRLISLNVQPQLLIQAVPQGIHYYL